MVSLLPLWEDEPLCNQLITQGKPKLVSVWCPLHGVPYLRASQGRALVRSKAGRVPERATAQITYHGASLSVPAHAEGHVLRRDARLRCPRRADLLPRLSLRASRRDQRGEGWPDHLRLSDIEPSFTCTRLAL
jgi:hypothetical protein